MNTNIKALVNRVKSRGQVGVIRALQHDFREDGRSECGANGNEDYWQRSIYPHHGQMSVYSHHGQTSVYPHQGQRSVYPHHGQRSIYPHHGQMSIYPHHVLFKGQQDREMFTHQNHLNV